MSIVWIGTRVLSYTYSFKILARDYPDVAPEDWYIVQAKSCNLACLYSDVSSRNDLWEMSKSYPIFKCDIKNYLKAPDDSWKRIATNYFAKSQRNNYVSKEVWINSYTNERYRIKLSMQITHYSFGIDTLYSIVNSRHEQVSRSSSEENAREALERLMVTP